MRGTKRVLLNKPNSIIIHKYLHSFCYFAVLCQNKYFLYNNSRFRECGGIVELNTLLGFYTMLAFNANYVEVDLPDNISELPLPV